VAQTLHTNDNDPATGIHRTGATPEELFAPQMVSVFEECGDGTAMCGREAAAQAEFCTYGHEAKAVVKRRYYAEEAALDGELVEWTARLARVDEPEVVPTSFRPRAVLEVDWFASVSKLESAWMKEVCETPGGQRWLVVDPSKAGPTRKMLLALGLKSTGALEAALAHLSPSAYARVDCSGSRPGVVRLSASAVVVLVSGAVQHTLLLPSTYFPFSTMAANSTSYAVSGRNDVSSIGRKLCAGLEAQGCQATFDRGLLHGYFHTPVDDSTLQPSYVMEHALQAVDRAYGKLRLVDGGQLKNFKCLLDTEKERGCKNFEGRGAAQLLACGDREAGQPECTAAAAGRAATAIQRAQASVAGMDARHGSDLRAVLANYTWRLEYLHERFDPSTEFKAVVDKAMVAARLAAHDLELAASEAGVREVAKKLIASGASEYGVGLSENNIKHCGEAGPKKGTKAVRGIDYAIYLAWDSRDLVFIGELHTALRCTSAPMPCVVQHHTAIRHCLRNPVIFVRSDVHPHRPRRTNPGARQEGLCGKFLDLGRARLQHRQQQEDGPERAQGCFCDVLPGVRPQAMQIPRGVGRPPFPILFYIYRAALVCLCGVR
jgi:hypothetical protein